MGMLSHVSHKTTSGVSRWKGRKLVQELQQRAVAEDKEAFMVEEYKIR